MSDESLVENEGINAGSAEAGERPAHGRHRAPGRGLEGDEGRADDLDDAGPAGGDRAGKDFTAAPDDVRAGGRPRHASTGLLVGDMDSTAREEDSELLGAPGGGPTGPGQPSADSGQDEGSLE